MNSIKRLELRQCRTCYDSTDNLQLLTSFVETTVDTEDEKTYVQLILEVCNINVMDDEPLGQWPQFICADCSNKLLSAHYFVQHSIKINKFLTSLADILNSKVRVDFVQKPELEITYRVKMEKDDDVEFISCEREFQYSPIENEVSEVQQPISTYEKWDNNLCNNSTSFEQSTNNKTIENDNEHIEEAFIPSSNEFISDDEMNTDALKKFHKKNTINNNLTEKSKRTCKQCNKLFTSSWHLRRHNSYVHASEEDKISCPKCAKKFSHVEQFQRHMETSLKVENQQPNKINKTLTAKEKSKINNDLAGLTCNECSKEEERNVCHICQRKFSRSDSCRRHLIRVHGTEVPSRKKNLAKIKSTKFFCHKCSQCYTQRDRLYKHIIKVHSH